MFKMWQPKHSKHVGVQISRAVWDRAQEEVILNCVLEQGNPLSNSFSPSEVM